MTKSSLLTVLALVVASVQAQGATYQLSQSLSGQGFLDAFQWLTDPDPTHGDVNFVDQGTAEQSGLCWINGDNSVTLSADSTTWLDGSGPGRNSFRLQSWNQYTTHVAIFDIAHMPEGCGTWPAIWYVHRFDWKSMLTWAFELGDDWPNQGEIDIMEGINNQSPSRSSLHTSSNCEMPGYEWMTGASLGNDCDVYDTSNTGCGVLLDDGNSFGPAFNDIGGGWYAIERSETYISIYFWERGSMSVPSEVAWPGGSVDTSTWGEPAAFFPNTSCDFPSHFGALNIMIDLTFCGDWAGSNYASSGCPSDCTDFVNQNPGAFANAYFRINALSIYQ